MKNIATIIGAAMLSACAGYQPPTSGSTATLTVQRAGEEGGEQFYVYKDANCTANPGGRFFYTTAGTAGEPTKKIAAGQELVLTGTWTKSGLGVAYVCSETVSFMPEEGKAYVATVSADMAANRCSVAVEERAADTKRPVASLRKNENLCYGPDNLGPRVNGVFNNIKGGGTTVVR